MYLLSSYCRIRLDISQCQDLSQQPVEPTLHRQCPPMMLISETMIVRRTMSLYLEDGEALTPTTTSSTETDSVDKLLDTAETPAVQPENQERSGMILKSPRIIVFPFVNMNCCRSYITPFILGVVTDNDENLSATSASSSGDSMNRGFRLFYRQHPCSQRCIDIGTLLLFIKVIFSTFL